jgi:hypothetical protein
MRGTPMARASTALLLVVLAAVALGGVARSEEPDSRPPSAAALPDSAAPAHRVLAYYFHSTQRCASCRRIEAWSREALEGAFPEELGDGRLVWLPVNIDEKENKHFVKDYQLFTKSLVLVDERGGDAARWKNLPRVWQLLRDQDGFFRYVREETDAFLAEEP